MRSIRSFNRARTDSGFALIAALFLAVLYFSLMQLMLIDTSRALSEANRFRARVLAAALAEDAAELAAVNMRTRAGRTAVLIEDDRELRGELVRVGNDFVITAEAKSIGVLTQQASVRVQGRMSSNGKVNIDYTMHGQ